MEVPSSTQRFIIGTKGATLKQIQTISSTRITVPKREKSDATPEVTENGDDEADDVPVSINIVGDADGVRIAKAEIMKIVGEKVKTWLINFLSAALISNPVIMSIDCNPNCQAYQH